MANEPIYGVGLDLGTMNIISARRTPSGVEHTRMRDAFLDLPATAKKMLRLSGTSFTDRGDEILVLGDAAMEVANVFGREARRPLSGGLISPGETDALEVLGLLINHVLGAPKVPGEHCYFSVPAAPVDQPGKDVVYHRGVFERIVKECGYTPHAANEAMAIIFSECAQDGFSGISLSFGAGMVNAALAVNTIEGMSFAVARSGDWIDKGASTAVGSTQARICAIKEAGFDLMKPIGRDQEALSFYYKAAVEHALDQIAFRFSQSKGQFELPKPIPMIVSGGTSMAGGFLTLFNEVFAAKKKQFPLQISEIRAARDPLNAVANGMLTQAVLEHEET